MTKKYCKKCDKEIEEGREQKVYETIEWKTKYEYYNPTTKYWHTSTKPAKAVKYWTCSKCYQKNRTGNSRSQGSKWKVN
jgi:hypothetical protein